MPLAPTLIVDATVGTPYLSASGARAAIVVHSATKYSRQGDLTEASWSRTPTRGARPSTAARRRRHGPVRGLLAQGPQDAALLRDASCENAREVAPPRRPPQGGTRLLSRRERPPGQRDRAPRALGAGGRSLRAGRGRPGEGARYGVPLLNALKIVYEGPSSGISTPWPYTRDRLAPGALPVAQREARGQGEPDRCPGGIGTGRRDRRHRASPRKRCRDTRNSLTCL